jgi:hypothetical protein
MLGYCGLRDLHPRNDIVDRPFLAIAEKADEISRRRRSATALKTSLVVAALAIHFCI